MALLIQLNISDQAYVFMHIKEWTYEECSSKPAIGTYVHDLMFLKKKKAEQQQFNEVKNNNHSMIKHVS